MWPINEANKVFSLSEGDPEVKNKVALVTSTDRSFASLANCLKYFSDYHRAKKAVALCLLYIQKLKERLKSRKPMGLDEPAPKIIQTRSTSQAASMKKATLQPQFITIATMQQAEMIMIRAVQAIHFDEEIKV